MLGVATAKFTAELEPLISGGSGKPLVCRSSSSLVKELSCAVSWVSNTLHQRVSTNPKVAAHLACTAVWKLQAFVMDAARVMPSSPTFVSWWEHTLEGAAAVPAELVESSNDVQGALAKCLCEWKAARNSGCFLSILDVSPAAVQSKLASLLSEALDNTSCIEVSCDVSAVQRSFYAKLSSVRALSDYYVELSDESYSIERAFLEAHVLGADGVDDEAYEAAVRKTYQNQLAIPCIRATTSPSAAEHALNEYRSFEVDDAMLQRHGPRLERTVAAMHDEKWFKLLLQWHKSFQQQQQAAATAAASDAPHRVLLLRRLESQNETASFPSEGPLLERLHAVTESMRRVGAGTSGQTYLNRLAFFTEFGLTFSEEVCEYGMPLEWAMRVSKLYSDAAVGDDGAPADANVCQLRSYALVLHLHLARCVVRYCVTELGALPLSSVLKELTEAEKMLHTAAVASVLSTEGERSVFEQEWVRGVVNPLLEFLDYAQKNCPSSAVAEGDDDLCIAAARGSLLLSKATICRHYPDVITATRSPSLDVLFLTCAEAFVAGLDALQRASSSLSLSAERRHWTVTDVSSSLMRAAHAWCTVRGDVPAALRQLLRVGGATTAGVWDMLEHMWFYDAPQGRGGADQRHEYVGALLAIRRATGRAPPKRPRSET